MKTVRFESPWFRNGQVVYPAGEDLLADGFNEQLIADGVAGTVTDVEPVQADGGPMIAPDTLVVPVADAQPSANPAA